jgi:hypothetical protein
MVSPEPTIENKELSFSDYERQLLGGIGIPVGTQEEAHVIKPSAINAFTKSMAQTINDLDVTERLRCSLRTAVANAFLNTHAIEFRPIMKTYPSLTGHLSFFLPNTIGEMKASAAHVAGYLKDAAWNYKRESTPDDPAATERAPTSRYLSRTYKGIFNAFNAVLIEEGLQPLTPPPQGRKVGSARNAL